MACCYLKLLQPSQKCGQSHRDLCELAAACTCCLRAARRAASQANARYCDQQMHACTAAGSPQIDQSRRSFFSPPHQNLNPFMRTAATAEPNPCLVSLIFFPDLVEAPHGMTKSLANYYTHSTAVLCHPIQRSSIIELGAEKASGPLVFFLFAASPLDRSASAYRSV
jgi:hypothetical protein